MSEQPQPIDFDKLAENLTPLDILDLKNRQMILHFDRIRQAADTLVRGARQASKAQVLVLADDLMKLAIAVRETGKYIVEDLKNRASTLPDPAPDKPHAPGAN